ncbi:uncharacterized protein LOC115227399 [Argonauta hians]
MEEVKKLKEREERQIAEKRQQKATEWQNKGLANKDPECWLQWPQYTYEINPDMYELSVGCVIRSQSPQFNLSSLHCDVIKQQQHTFTYEPQEELVSFIIQISQTDTFVNTDEPLYIAVPHFTSRASTISREVFIKMKTGSHWYEVPTIEVTVDSHKEIKFAQTLLRVPALYAVVSRLKRDYITFTTISTKVTSSYDQRITFSIEKDCFSQKEHVLLTAQPVDSTSISELRSHKNSFKGLLSSSPIITTQWESNEFLKPILVTLPCPPNPAKVKRIAAIKAQREERIKNPKMAMLEEAERERERKKKSRERSSKQTMARSRTGTSLTDDDSVTSHTEGIRPNQRWYMGRYANNDDDENDQLFFVACTGNKTWTVGDVTVTQLKLDQLQLMLYQPYRKFLVLRTRTTVNETLAVKMAAKLENYISQRLVQVILRRSVLNDLQYSLHVVPLQKCTSIFNKLKESEFTNSPPSFPVISVEEGQLIEIKFRGNLKNTTPQRNSFIYNSNLNTSIDFSVLEIDKYLQKNFPVFRGYVRLFRHINPPEVKRKNKVEEENLGFIDSGYNTTLEFLTEIPLSIPKTHILPNPVHIRAQVVIRNRDDPVNEVLMQELAIALGDEWRRLSHQLNITSIRLQAIWRNTQACEWKEEQAKYEMLMTWLKTLPKCVDKISVLCEALNRCGRPDLMADVRMRNLVFQQQKDDNRHNTDSPF